ncbi:MAG TPA: hypothetical protein VJ914_21165 [Pseudonocardiaceae bacterium]|nr:hypothetical protein [Pseudonocardiaceae bacterium]
MQENDDEDRVREALLAAVDEQLVPPVRTDLAEIVQRGKRRARLQVISASAAAVLLIAAVALGATMLGKLGGPQRVSAANGSSSSLPVTAQTITTTPNPAPSGVPRSAYAEGPCVYPGLALPSKWAHLNDKQNQAFLAGIRAYGYSSVSQFTPAVADALPDVDQDAAMSAAVVSHGQLDLVTVSATYYSGPASIAAQVDSAQANMPATCFGILVDRPYGKFPLINEYESKGPAPGTHTTFLRVQTYSDSGVRYDVTEAINATDLTAYANQEVASTTSASGSTPLRPTGQPPVSMTQLVNLAIEMATLG